MRYSLAVLIACLAGLPFVIGGDYYLALATQVLLWSLVYTAWSIMGRFGLVSFGHGAFLGIGAYVTVILWNYVGLTPWIGIVAGMAVAIAVAVGIGYPGFRVRIVGNYFVLITLALGEMVRLLIIALRGWTGGSLGLTPVRAATGQTFYAMQISSRPTFYFIALIAWIIGLAAWQIIDRSMIKLAMEAVDSDEDAAASIGVSIMRNKLIVTVVSAGLTALGGGLLGMYFMYINPGTLSGLNVSLQIVFAAVVGGMGILLGPSIGALFTIGLSEILRITVGNQIHGLDTTIFGILLIVFIIFLSKGIGGSIAARFAERRKPADHNRAGGVPAQQRV